MRNFILFMSMFLLTAWSHANNTPPPLAGIAFSCSTNCFKYNSNYPTKYGNGDTYYTTWADDGKIYTTQGDVQSQTWWQGTGPVGGSNMAISTFDGFTTGLTATGVNDLNASFGPFATNGSDGRSWKPCGIISVSGTLYVSASRQGSNYTDTQIIKSTDHGSTWTPLPPSQGAPFTTPMFPGVGFSCGGPIQYGQDYQGNTVDNSNTYVYWIFTQWGADHDTLFLARVKIADLSLLDSSKYSYYTGGDGMLSANWSSAVGSAVAILTDTGKLGATSGQYIMGRYMLISVNHPSPPGDSTDDAWSIYEAPKPWGPWTRIGYYDWKTGLTEPGLYWGFPTPKSISVTAANGITPASATGTIFSSGNFQFANAQTGSYTLWILNFTVNN